MANALGSKSTPQLIRELYSMKIEPLTHEDGSIKYTADDLFHAVEERQKRSIASLKNTKQSLAGRAEPYIADIFKEIPLSYANQAFAKRRHGPSGD